MSLTMPAKNSTSVVTISLLILVVGIIHFGVEIRILAKSRRYRDIFQQSVGLSFFNTVIDIYAIGSLLYLI